MNITDRICKSYDCLDAFKTASNNEVMKQFVDIFFHMFFEENEHHLEVSVGHRKSKSMFDCWLRTITNKYNICLSHWNNEPQFIFKDVSNYSTNIMAINLALMRDLNIKTEEIPEFNRYIIDFNYNNQIDYNISLVVHKK